MPILKRGDTRLMELGLSEKEIRLFHPQSCASTTQILITLCRRERENHYGFSPVFRIVFGTGPAARRGCSHDRITTRQRGGFTSCFPISKGGSHNAPSTIGGAVSAAPAHIAAARIR